MKLKGKHLTIERLGDSCIYTDALRIQRMARKDMIVYLKERIESARSFLDELTEALEAVEEEPVAPKDVKPKRYPPGKSGVVPEEKKRGAG